MEDPAREVEGVVRALVDKPTLRRQAETLQRYFTPDVEFYHPYIQSNWGLTALIAIYQVAELFLNYSGVDFENIVYDAKENAIGVRMTVYIRPWILLTRTTPLYFFAMLELEDVIVGGKKVKKIRVQRDYFIRSPTIQLIPIIGELYNSQTLWFLIGNFNALLFQGFIWLLSLVFPIEPIKVE
jgi:hypothetical protein